MDDLRGVFVAWGVIYLVLIYALAVFVSRKVKGAGDYTLMGRRLNPWLGSMTWLASYFSAITLLGFLGSIYDSGYFFISAVMFGLILGSVITYVIAPRIRAQQATSLGDVLVKTIGSSWARPISGAVLTFEALAFLIIQLLGISLILSFVMGWSYVNALTVITIAFVVYTVIGGLRAVAWTDLVQGVILLAGTFFITIMLIVQLGGMTEVNDILRTEVGADYLRALPENTTAWGYFVALIGFTVTFAQQNNITRVNASRSVKDARLMVAISTAVIGFIYSFVLIVLGGAARAYVVKSGMEVNNQDQILLEVVADAFPPWMAVLAMLVLLSGILSTTDSRLHDLGVLSIRDLYRPYIRRNATEKHYLLMARVFTLIWAVVAYLIAIDPPGAIIDIFDDRTTVMAAALLVPVIVSLYWRRLTPIAGVTGMVAGFVTGIVLVFAPIELPPNLSAAFIGVMASIIGLLIGQVVGVKRRRSMADSQSDRTGSTERV